MSGRFAPWAGGPGHIRWVSCVCLLVFSAGFCTFPLTDATHASDRGLFPLTRAQTGAAGALLGAGARPGAGAAPHLTFGGGRRGEEAGGGAGSARGGAGRAGSAGPGRAGSERACGGCVGAAPLRCPEAAPDLPRRRQQQRGEEAAAAGRGKEGETHGSRQRLDVTPESSGAAGSAPPDSCTPAPAAGEGEEPLLLLLLLLPLHRGRAGRVGGWLGALARGSFARPLFLSLSLLSFSLSSFGPPVPSSGAGEGASWGFPRAGGGGDAGQGEGLPPGLPCPPPRLTAAGLRRGPPTRPPPFPVMGAGAAAAPPPPSRSARRSPAPAAQ